MLEDLRSKSLWQDIENLAASFRRPGSGRVSDASDLNVSPDGKEIVFSGAILDSLSGLPRTKICAVDVESSSIRVLTTGGGTDRSPKFSPNGEVVAFLSDKERPGSFQLCFLNSASEEEQPQPDVDGWIEYFHWSPDGNKILLGVAAPGSDISAIQGAVSVDIGDQAKEGWLPSIERSDVQKNQRSVWIYETSTKQTRKISDIDMNVWEAAWCGNAAFTAIVSPGSLEGDWFSAKLILCDLDGRNSRFLYAPKDQLGLLAAAPSGQTVAVVEAFCSDRLVVAGDLLLIDVESGVVVRADTASVDISHCEWRSDETLLVAGHRGFETVCGTWSQRSNCFTQQWASKEITSWGNYFSIVAGIGTSCDFAIVGEGFNRAPEIAVVRGDSYEVVKSLDLGYSTSVEGLKSIEFLEWSAPDGLIIQGYFLEPRLGNAPYPVVMIVHGGPIGHSRPRCFSRSGLHVLALLNRGYAVFYPNPRGSAGRGQDFARRVFGDIGGAETADNLAGLDYLVGTKRADSDRLGVTGVSHGGYMTSWLVTQDHRFAAAVPVSPVTNFVTQELLSNVPHFVSLFLDDRISHLGGRHYTRSPVSFAHQVRTPTLSICGALDKCTPPAEAVQFYNALRLNGVSSALVTYPQEGHNIRKMPACFDYAVRLVEWFERYMPAACRNNVAGVS